LSIQEKVSLVVSQQEKEKAIHLEHEYFQGNNHGNEEEGGYDSKEGCNLENENATQLSQTPEYPSLKFDGSIDENGDGEKSKVDLTS
jgi:hypothetical protein